ncbi:protein kinase [Streptomyces sp. NA02950]|uniref:penicillin-binding transpeptidase domain-containing protein n=1 Tax=Streptomyces sp. NA02950 TaxID=2742137 RepID=UPI0015929061|nr:penicillin-binding transpeptidase domain-containing protein [Streptomyces sp. NA02950]QKV92560.1 protein kinase [Streptomyces sp. NA02950]
MEALGRNEPTEIAGYRVRGRLGVGGMGAVYLAYTRGGQPVALKVIRDEYAQDPEFRRRFAREVEVARRVQGPYTASVVDSDTDSPRPWLASAYVAGPALSTAVNAYGALPPTTVLQLVAGVAEALQSIHRAGLIHRDLKPSNVLLASDGPRVIDFGIAHAMDATALTGPDVRLGTPGFMAPEQIAGRDVSPARDVFALGLLAHFAATGAHPFGEGSSHALLYRIVAEEPDLDDCPEVLRGLVDRCLAKDPQERPTPTGVIEICRELAGEGLLERDSRGWLPEAVAGHVARRERRQSDAPSPPSGAPDGTGPGNSVPDSPARSSMPVSPAPDVRPDVQAPSPGGAAGRAPDPRVPHSSASVVPPVPSSAPPAPPVYSPYTPDSPYAPQRSQPPSRSRARVALAVVAALAVIGGGVFTVVKLTGDDGTHKDADAKGGSIGSGGKGGLGDILVGGKPVTGSKHTANATFPYKRTYTDGALYYPVTGQASQSFGASGLEGVYREVLNGTEDGLKAPGNVVTTVDPAVQKAAYEALGDAKGAAVAVDPSNGEILGMVSTPSYDPSSFAGSTSDDQEAWRKANNDKDKPLLNRALRSTYPPGATFELVVTAAALENGLYDSIDEATESPEPYALPGSTTVVRNGDGAAHCENVSLRVALRESCNTVFAKAASDLGEEKLRTMAEKFGFNNKEQFTPVAAAESTYPSGADRAHTALSGLGQGDVTATPLQLAMVSAALENDGTLVAPHLVSRVTDAEGRTLRKGSDHATTQVVSAATAGALRSAMADVIAHGAGRAARVSGADLGGQPGTASGAGTGAGAGAGAANWFTSYARSGGGGGKRVAIAVVVEDDGPDADGQNGGSRAAGTAKRIMRAAIG